MAVVNVTTMAYKSLDTPMTKQGLKDSRVWVTKNCYVADIGVIYFKTKKARQNVISIKRK